MLVDMVILLQSCPVAPEPTFDLPEVGLEDVFPFSLIVYVFKLMTSFGSGGTAPSIDMGLFGTVSVGGEFGAAISLLRTGMGVLIVGGSCLWFYRHITGKGSDG